MKPIDRNPDINLDLEEIPKGMQLIEGKSLMQTARVNNIPFGVASAKNLISKNSRRDTIGLIIRDEDVERFNAAYQKKIARKLAESMKP